LNIPRVDKSEEGFERVNKVTSELKKGGAAFYASYLFYILTAALPRMVAKFLYNDTIKKATMIFTNNPGPVKPLKFTNKKT